jgi:hypothetical protein
MKTARTPFTFLHRSSLPHRHGRLASQLAAFTRRAARRLELRSFPLLQEQFSAEEGWRACLAIALPLAAAMISGQNWLAWAVFAAFWTCLCDAPGPHTQRRRLLAGFAVAGTAVAFIGSWSASWSSHAALLTAPVMVLLSVTLTGAIQSAALLGTLLALPCGTWWPLLLPPLLPRLLEQQLPALLLPPLLLPPLLLFQLLQW